MKLVFGGDVCASYGCDGSVFKNKETDKAFGPKIQKLFKSADDVIVNLETAITESDHKIEKFGPNLKSPFGTGDVMKEAGITICACSNNHIFDYGKPGTKDTFEELDRCGIAYTGYGKNNIDARRDLILEKDGVTVAIINVCEHEYSYALENREGAREYDPYDTMEDIMAAKKNADHVIVVFHGGKEMCEYPSPRLLKMCRSMINHGATAVMCQHTHCIGCYEEYNGGHILYGQGNFHFKHPSSTPEAARQWNTCMTVVMDITKESVKFEMLPTELVEDTLELCEGEMKDALNKELKERSVTIKDGTWIEGWRAFVASVPWYEGGMMEGNKARMGHWMECEAHYDVLREIFKTANQTNELD